MLSIENTSFLVGLLDMESNYNIYYEPGLCKHCICNILLYHLMVKYEAITITTLLMRKVALDRLINLPKSQSLDSDSCFPNCRILCW